MRTRQLHRRMVAVWDGMGDVSKAGVGSTPGADALALAADTGGAGAVGIAVYVTTVGGVVEVRAVLAVRTLRGSGASGARVGMLRGRRLEDNITRQRSWILGSTWCTTQDSWIGKEMSAK